MKTNRELSPIITHAVEILRKCYGGTEVEIIPNDKSKDFILKIGGYELDFIIDGRNISR